MHNFTPFAALIGGILIGLSASAMLLLEGKIAGISGIFAGVLNPAKGETAWKASFVAGLLAGGVLLRIFLPRAFDFGIIRPYGDADHSRGCWSASARGSATDAPAATAYAASAGCRRARWSRR